MKPTHTSVLLHNRTNPDAIVRDLLAGTYPQLHWLTQHQVGEVSTAQLAYYLDLEARRDTPPLTSHNGQSLRSMSSGERKKTLLYWILQQKPEVLLLVDPFDGLDQEAQQQLATTIAQYRDTMTIVQLVNRRADCFPFITHHYDLVQGQLKRTDLSEPQTSADIDELDIPPPIAPSTLSLTELVRFQEVSVQFNGRQVLTDISWTITPGTFWQLQGPNGSGKSTLLQIITGDSHKGYGQHIILFGYQKGHGESVWELKQHIGYFSPAMIDGFKGYHTVMEMLLSGLHDSVGLYRKPTKAEQRTAQAWLQMLPIAKASIYFRDLSEGEKRLVMTARAMIKHPPLLILDEPTTGLDDINARLFVNLVNRYAAVTQSAILYVSHRPEPGLTPEKTFTLYPTANGSIGKVS
ncbi:MAG: ATP-binding cassette domain-containing protein [Bacteroidota bacterium]